MWRMMCKISHFLSKLLRIGKNREITKWTILAKTQKILSENVIALVETEHSPLFFIFNFRGFQL
jgi:hypothetical protein